MAQSITDILRKTKEKIDQLNTPQVAKVRGVARLLSIIIDVLRVLTAMQKKMSELEARVKKLEDQLSSKEDRVG